MKKFLLLLVLSIGLIAALAACNGEESTNSSSEQENSWERIESSGELVIGTSGTYHPITYMDPNTNELTGFEVEVVRELAKRLNLTPVFTTMEFDGILPALRNEQIDIAANDFTITPERLEKFDFTTPHKFSYGSAIVRADADINSVEDLKGIKIGGSLTSNYSEFARENGAEVIAYSGGGDTILRDIINGRIDAQLNDLLVLQKTLNEFNNDQVKLAENLKFQPNVGALVMKKDSPELKEKLDAVITEMLADGTIKELGLEFLGADITQQVTEEDLK